MKISDKATDVKNASSFQTQAITELEARKSATSLILIISTMFFWGASKRMSFDEMYLTLDFLLVSGIALIAFTAHGIKRGHERLLALSAWACFLFGGAGSLEAVVSFVGLYTKNYALYDFYNTFVYIPLIGLTAICVTIHFFAKRNPS